uniref:Uncharacterized protein n=1 Tax=Romanomermis culicivorax TaxID=13658 RepID=A0A915JBI6_ROMCU
MAMNRSIESEENFDRVNEMAINESKTTVTSRNDWKTDILAKGIKSFSSNFRNNSTCRWLTKTYVVPDHHLKFPTRIQSNANLQNSRNSISPMSSRTFNISTNQ